MKWIALLLPVLFVLPPAPAAALPCRGFDQVEDPMTEIRFYNTARSQGRRRAIRYVFYDGFFNFEFCQVIGEPFSLDNFNDYEPDDCEYLSDYWISLDDAESFNRRFMAVLQKHIEENYEAKETYYFTEGTLRSLQAIPTSLVSMSLLWLMHRHPELRLTAGRTSSRVIRGLAWLTLLGELAWVMALEFKSEELNSETRAVDLDRLIRHLEEENVTGKGFGDYQADRLTYTIKSALEETFEYMVLDLCGA